MSLMKRMLDAGVGRSRRRYDLRDRAAGMYELGAARDTIRAAISEVVKHERRSGAASPVGGDDNPFVDMVLTGDTELDALFVELPQSLQKKALRPATRAVAKMVLAQAKAEVPENTGLLLSELRIKAKKRSRRYPHTVGMTVGFRDDLFRGDTFYAGMLEFGTKRRYQRIKAKNSRTRALVRDVLLRKGRYTGRIDDTQFSFLRPALFSYPERKQAVYREAITGWLRNHRVKQGAGSSAGPA